MEKKSLLANLSYTTIGMILYNIALWFLGFFILRILGPVESGYYSVAMSVGATLYGVALWGLRSYIVSSSEKFGYGDYLIVRMFSIVVSILCLSLYLIFSNFDFYQTMVIILYSIFKFSESAIELLDCFYQKSLKMDINAKSMIMRSVLLVGGFYFSILLSKSLIIGLLIMILVTLLVLFTYNFKKLKEINFNFYYEIDNIKKIIILTLPIMGFEMLSALTVAIPRIKYSEIGDLGLLGIYSSIYTIIVFLQLVIQIMIVSFAPYMAKDYFAYKIKSFTKKLALLFVISILLGLVAEGCVYFLGEFVIGLVYGNDIAKYYSYMYLAIISGTTLGMTWIFSQLFVILRRNYTQLLCAFISMITCYVLSVKLVNPNDLNSISLVLIYANITFCVIAGILLFKSIISKGGLND